LPETYEGKLEMAKISQKLDDHIVTQTINDQKVNETLARIESKLDTKASCDMVDNAVRDISTKADKADIRQLQQNQWGLVVGILLALIGVLAALIKGHVF
jgi:uncharacterized protein YacL